MYFRKNESHRNYCNCSLQTRSLGSWVSAYLSEVYSIFDFSSGPLVSRADSRVSQTDFFYGSKVKFSILSRPKGRGLCELDHGQWRDELNGELTLFVVRVECILFDSIVQDHADQKG